MVINWTNTEDNIKENLSFKKKQKTWKKDDLVEYKSVCKSAKNAVSKVKLDKYDELYESLDIKKGEGSDIEMGRIFWGIIK